MFFRTCLPAVIQPLDGASGQLIRQLQVYLDERQMNYLRIVKISHQLLKTHLQAFQSRDLKYLDVILGNQRPFPSQVAHEPFFIDGLQIGYYIPNLQGEFLITV